VAAGEASRGGVDDSVRGKMELTAGGEGKGQNGGIGGPDEMVSHFFLCFLAEGLGMCADGAVDSHANGMRTLFWVANSLRLKGDGIKRVVWG
jgi:hypothetical protein